MAEQTAYDQWQQQQEEANRNLRVSVANDMQIEPDRASRIWAVQVKTKLPPEVVDAGLEDLEKQLLSKQFNRDDYTDAINGSPVFNKFAAENPYNIAVLERDRKNLTRLERSLAPIFQGWDKGFAMTEMADIVGRQMENPDQPQSEGDMARLKELRQLMQGADTSKGFTKFLRGAAEQLPIQSWIIKEGIDEAALGMTTGAAVGSLYGGAGGTFVAPGFGTVAGYLSGGAGGGMVGLGVGFAAGRTKASMDLETALAFDQYREAGLDEKDARLVANVAGTIAGSFESLSLGVITKKLPGFREIQRDATGELVNRLLAKPTMQHAFARLAVNYGEVMATEILTESLQESVTAWGGEILKSDARERGDIRPETEAMTGDDWKEMLLSTIEHTFYGTALIGGMGPATQFYGDAKRANAATQMVQAYKTLGETAKGSTTRTDTPSKWTEFVSRLSDAGQNKTIQIEATKFKEYFQSQGMDIDQVASTLGVTPEAMKEGTEITGFIDVPLKGYLETIAPTEHHNALIKDLRTDSEQFTAREAEAFYANEKEAMKTIEGAAETLAGSYSQDEQIVTDIIGQLRALNYTGDAASKSAEILRGIPNLARKAGMEPLELFNQVFGGVRGPRNKNLQHQDVDAQVDPFLDMIRAGNIPTQRDIFGPSLLDFISQSGGLAPDAELDARDFRAQAVASGRVGAIRNDGDTLDGMAERAHEAGFIAERDPNLLLDAIDRELGGDAVHSTLATDENKQNLAGMLGDLSRALDEEGIDIATMSNAEIRAKLKVGKAFDQIDTDNLGDLGDVLFSLVATEHIEQGRDFSHYRTKSDTILAEAEVLLGQKRESMAKQQDFGDVTITDTFVHRGKVRTRTVRAQKEYDQTVKRRNLLKKLLDCLNG